jgi:hypothetical protein
MLTDSLSLTLLNLILFGFGFPKGWWCLSALARVACKSVVPKEYVSVGAATAVFPVVPILAVNRDESNLLQFLDVAAGLSLAEAGLLSQGWDRREGNTVLASVAVQSAVNQFRAW